MNFTSHPCINPVGMQIFFSKSLAMSQWSYSRNIATFFDFPITNGSSKLSSNFKQRKTMTRRMGYIPPWHPFLDLGRYFIGNAQKFINCWLHETEFNNQHSELHVLHFHWVKKWIKSFPLLKMYCKCRFFDTYDQQGFASFWIFRKS